MHIGQPLDYVVQHYRVEQEPVYLFRRKGQPEFCTCDRERYDELSGHALFETRILYDLPAAPTQGGDV